MKSVSIHQNKARSIRLASLGLVIVLPLLGACGGGGGGGGGTSAQVTGAAAVTAPPPAPPSESPAEQPEDEPADVSEDTYARVYLTSSQDVDFTEGRIPARDPWSRYGFPELLRESTRLVPQEDTASLVEACGDARCYSAIVTTAQLEAAEQLGTEVFFLTALSTAIANELSGLPPEEATDRLQQITELLLVEPTGENDYVTLLTLDLHGSPADLSQLTRPALLEAAEALILKNGLPRISELIADAGVQTSELLASDTFVFSSSWDLAVDVDISSRRVSPTFLAICGEYVESEDGYEVDYADCQLKTPLDAGRYIGSLRMTGNSDELLVTIIPMDDPTALEYQLWSRAEEGPVLTVR